MRHLQVTVATERGPADGDEVARNVQATLATEDDVMQGRLFQPSPTDSAALPIPLEDVVPNVRWHQVHPLELQL